MASQWKDSHEIIIEPATLTSATFEELVREMIVRIGEDPDREGLIRTPDRVRTFLGISTRGYKEDPDAMLQEGALHRHL